jgi:AcrR family transcriptional regulator
MARTPSSEAHQKVLKAALELIAERGIEGTSMDAIAQLSGVSKATVYKHWASKDALCIEAVASLQGKLPEFNSGDPRADITSLLRHLAHARKSELWGRIWPRLVGYAAGNPEFAQALRAQSTEKRQVQLGRLLKKAWEKGDLRKDIDLDLAMDLLVGPVMHRRFMNSAVPTRMPEHVVDAFWRAWGRER